MKVSILPISSQLLFVSTILMRPKFPIMEMPLPLSILLTPQTVFFRLTFFRIASFKIAFGPLCSEPLFEGFERMFH
ncbi:MAG: hypothetical protein K2X66_02080, partial [Cyanobacteria bacterium]|nr:hypothetical protein [Cyanobacteriota bacterium]